MAHSTSPCQVEPCPMMWSPGVLHPLSTFCCKCNYRLSGKPADAILTMVALLCCNLVRILLLTCLWGDDAGPTAPVGKWETSAFFFPFEECTSCTNSQKLEVVVQLNPGLHDAPRHDLCCFTKIATAAASDLFFTSQRCSSSLALGRQAKSLQASKSEGCCLQSFSYFILLLERERVMVGSVDCKHPCVFSRHRGLQRGQEVANVQDAAHDSVIYASRADLLHFL